MSQPARSAVGVKNDDVAFGMSKQLFVLSSHLVHWYLNVIGALSVHVPVVAVRKKPICGASKPTGSVIFGRTVFTGPGPPVMVAVRDDVAVAEPQPFVAFSITWICWPTSASTVWYVVPVPTSRQKFVVSQRCHVYDSATLYGGVHVPGFAVRTFVRDVPPLIDGGETFFSCGWSSGCVAVAVDTTC